jgi:hypothetical protein
LRQLKQRVALHCRLAPLKSFEIRHYIDLRLKTVGYKGNELFEAKALERITFYSRGTPRLINVICDNALLIAYGASKRKVSAEIIEEVASDLDLNAPSQHERAATKFNIAQSGTAVERRKSHRREFSIIKRVAPLHWTKSPGPALVLLLVLLAGGSALYFQQSRNYLMRIAMVARDFVGTDTRNSKHANLNLHVVKKGGATENWTAVSQTRLDDRFTKTKEERNSTGGKAQTAPGKSTQSIDIQTAPPQSSTRKLEGKIAPTPPINEPTESRPPKSSVPQVASTQIREPGIHTPDRSKQRSEAPRYWPNDKPVNVGSQRSPGKEQRFFRRHFEVVRNSIAFEKPTRNSALIATLRPGTWVRVEEKVGNYLHVRSLNDPWIRGYVHEEDAFFEYIGFER